MEKVQDKVDIFLSARNLKNMSLLSKTDAFAVLYLLDPHENQLILLDTTDVVMDSLNPDYAKPVTIDYTFGRLQEIVVKFYHLNSGYSTSKLAKHTYIGETTFLLSNLMVAPGQHLSINITGASSTKSVGTLELRGELQVNTRDTFVVNFVAANLNRMNGLGFFGKADPFLIISRVNEDGSWTDVFRSERIMSNLNPRWPQHRILLSTLCNGDIDRPLQIQVWDYESTGRHQPMGVVYTSVRVMTTNNNAPMDIIEEEKKKKNKNYVNSGTLIAMNATVESLYSLSDYVAGGCEISLILGIDFTASNGDPRDTRSLHYIHPDFKAMEKLPTELQTETNHNDAAEKVNATANYNEYQHAILTVGNVLEPYDSDKMYGVYGFGAKIKLPTGGTTPCQHSFPLYGNGYEVQGISGVLNAYHEVMNHIVFSGPTLFEPLINMAAGMAAAYNCSQAVQKYLILLIITDGEVNDFEQTKAAIVKAASQPLSIVIVGVGNEDFTNMKTLDDNIPNAPRDIVKFVPYREQMKRDPYRLAAAVLSEIPMQFLSFMKSRGITPNLRKS